MTDEELDQAASEWEAVRPVGPEPPEAGQTRDIERWAIRWAEDVLVMARRLRSDEWLQRAAEEIAADGDAARRRRDGLLAILRKHRDGFVLDHAFIPDHHAGGTCAFAVGDHKYCGKTEAEHRDGSSRP